MTRIDHLITASCALKERAVAERPEDADLAPTTVVWRDGKELAVVFTRTVSRDAGLDGTLLAVSGYSADEAVLITDTYQALPAFTERFERLPDPGELQHLAANGLHLDTWCEALTLVSMTRAGETALAVLPYRVEAGRIEWLDVIEKGHVSGYVVDVLAQCFAAPTLADAPMTPPSATRSELDMQATTVLCDLGYGVAYSPADDEAAAEVRRRMAAEPGFTLVDPDGTTSATPPGSPDLGRQAVQALRPALERRWAEERAADDEARAMNRAQRRLAARNKGKETY